MLLILPFLALPPAMAAYVLVAWFCGNVLKMPPRPVLPGILRLWGSATIAMFFGIGAFHRFGNHIGSILLVWLGVWLFFGLIAFLARRESLKLEEERYRKVLRAPEDRSKSREDGRGSS